MIGIGKKESQPNKLLPGVCVEGEQGKAPSTLSRHSICEDTLDIHKRRRYRVKGPWTFVAKIDEPFATFHSP